MWWIKKPERSYLEQMFILLFNEQKLNKTNGAFRFITHNWTKPNYILIQRWINVMWNVSHIPQLNGVF